MSVAKEFTTDRNTDVKTAGNRVIEGCNSLLVAYTRDSFKVRAGLPTENKNAVSLAGVEIIVLEGGVIRVPAAIRGHATFGFLISGIRGAKHFHTAAPMGRRCESAFELLSHQKVTKRLFSAEICDKIEDGITSGKGAILWELRFRA